MTDTLKRVAASLAAHGQHRAATEVADISLAIKTASTKEAGNDTVLMIRGTPKKGELVYRMKVTLSPRFTGKDLDNTIRTLAREKLLNIVKAANRETVWVTVSITDEYASDQDDGIWLISEANWAGKGGEFAEALAGFSRSFGYTLDSRL